MPAVFTGRGLSQPNPEKNPQQLSSKAQYGSVPQQKKRQAVQLHQDQQSSITAYEGSSAYTILEGRANISSERGGTAYLQGTDINNAGGLGLGPAGRRENQETLEIGLQKSTQVVTANGQQEAELPTITQVNLTLNAGRTSTAPQQQK